MKTNFQTSNYGKKGGNDMSCGNCTDCSNKCDVCQNCDSSNSRCNTQQTLCSGSRMKGQLASAYVGSAGAPSIKRDDIIIKVFPRSTLNSLIDYVGKAANYGDTKTSGGWKGSHETRDFIYADKIQSLIAGMKSLTSDNDPGVSSEVEKGKVIYASTFQAIMSKLNNLKVSPGACDICISSCNATCNTCNSCDSCISCNSCQSVSSYSSHYSSCNTPSKP